VVFGLAVFIEKFEFVLPNLEVLEYLHTASKALRWPAEATRKPGFRPGTGRLSSLKFASGLPSPLPVCAFLKIQAGNGIEAGIATRRGGPRGRFVGAQAKRRHGFLGRNWRSREFQFPE
jgi:hypothetical protein